MWKVTKNLYYKIVNIKIIHINTIFKLICSNEVYKEIDS